MLQEQSTTNIWSCISICIQQVLSESSINPNTVRGIGFCATCSLAVFSHSTNLPVSISINSPSSFFSAQTAEQNVILWLDHRPVLETEKINATKDRVLDFVGGKMSVEMEIPKILWLKNHMPKELFADCKFYDLVDALTFLATDEETRSVCSVVCKQGYLPHGVDGGEKGNGWRDEFVRAIGLEELMEDNYSRLGGINRVVSVEFNLAG